MAIGVNSAQINTAAGNNHALRETLSGISAAIDQLNAQTGVGPLKKVDTTQNTTTPPPSPAGIAVTGANGSFTVTISPPQAATGARAPANATNKPIYFEISSSATPNFVTSQTASTTAVTVYPVSTSTHFVFPNPGATLSWRVRSSYNQQNWSSYVTLAGGPVAAGLQTSIASSPNLSLNQSNFATVDSVGAGASATIRIYGSGGVGTAWASILGANSKVIPAGTILNVTYGATKFVAWDGSMYQLVASLTQTFPDGWIPVGKVSVISNGAGLVLPEIHPVISSGAIVAYDVTAGGNDITGPLDFTIFDSGGGSGATVGADAVSAGVLQSLAPGNPGAAYSSATTVTATGGVSGGVGGGGGPTGANTGRFYGGTT